MHLPISLFILSAPSLRPTLITSCKNEQRRHDDQNLHMLDRQTHDSIQCLLVQEVCHYVNRLLVLALLLLVLVLLLLVLVTQLWLLSVQVL